MGFTSDRVVKIAGNIGGSKNIEAVKAAYQALKALGFIADQVVKIAGHGGGSKNIEAVQAAYQALKDLGFNADLVVKIVGHDGGSKNIEAMKEHYHNLFLMGYSKEELVSIVACKSGSRKVYDIAQKNAVENEGDDFWCFLNKLLHDSSTTDINELVPPFGISYSQNISSILNTTGTLFSPAVTGKRKKIPMMILMKKT